MKVRRWAGQGAHTRKKNPHGIFAAGGALVPAQEKKKKKDLKILVTLE